ncbi:MAG: DUF3857 and transglutaminase domain-containing protein [Pyrinomonadaceae bacterium]
MNSLARWNVFATISLVVFLTVVGASAQDKDWRPVDSADLQSKTPIVEPDADAEVLFWEVRVDDADPQNLVMKHYIRVKVFNERGREKYSKIDIPYSSRTKIKDINARVIKADGTIADVAKADVFDREIAKTDKSKVKAKSFAVPAVDPGSIVEYRYQEVQQNSSANNMRMLFQHDVPIRSISYYFRPYQDAKFLSFNMADNKFVKDKNGFYRATMENLPALKSEPNMPPEDEVRSWMLLYYDRIRKNDTAMNFWSRAGGWLVEVFDIKDTLKPGKDIKAAAAQIAAGAATPEEKLARLFEFCKTKVKNVTYDPQLTDDQREEIKPAKSVSDTYKNLQGTASEINELFASLATALGFEARLAFSGDRSEKFFNPSQAHESFIHFAAAAVKVDGRWQYFSPGDKFVPYGMLAWNEEDTSVLLLGYKDFVTTETGYTSHERSLAKRTGKFKLLEDGTLEGTVRMEYTGQLANELKLNNYKSSPNKRQEDLKDEIKKRISTAEITDISIENVDDPEKPFVYQFKVRVPSYAQRTGKRLFLQPGFFEYGSTPMFTTATRKYPIFFHFPWSEDDEISIQLPAGFQLDNADSPEPVQDANGISNLQFKLSIDQTTNTLLYRRNFFFGGAGKTYFGVETYRPLKSLFDAFHKSNTHAVTLKQN